MKKNIMRRNPIGHWERVATTTLRWKVILILFISTFYPEYTNGNVKEDNTNSSNANNWSTTIDFTKNFKTGWSFVSGGRIIVSTRNSDFYSWDRLNKLVRSY